MVGDFNIFRPSPSDIAYKIGPINKTLRYYMDTFFISVSKRKVKFTEIYLNVSILNWPN